MIEVRNPRRYRAIAWTAGTRWVGRLRWNSTPLVWFVLMAYVGLVAFVTNLFLPDALKDPQQRSFFALPSIMVVSLIGLAGAWCSTRAGILEVFDQRVSNRRRYLIPAIAGLAVGASLVGYDLMSHFAKMNAAHFGLASQYSGLIPMALSFSAAAIIAVGVIDLLPVPVVTHLISNVILRGKGQAITFWIAASAMSLVEPASQDAWAFQAGQAEFIPVFLIQYLADLAEFWFFRRAGLLAAVVFRLGVYAVWHVAYPH
jgi:hypothetical protein